VSLEDKFVSNDCGMLCGALLSVHSYQRRLRLFVAPLSKNLHTTGRLQHPEDQFASVSNTWSI
jgi:hypothetical protein